MASDVVTGRIVPNESSAYTVNPSRCPAFAVVAVEMNRRGLPTTIVDEVPDLAIAADAVTAALPAATPVTVK